MELNQAGRRSDRSNQKAEILFALSALIVYKLLRGRISLTRDNIKKGG